MIILDTHILVWLDQDDDALGPDARSMITLEHAEERLGISAISFWEIGMLVAKRRLKFAMDLDVWRGELLAAGYIEIPIDGRIAIVAAQLTRFHGDPADRLLVATALIHNAGLVTADKKILRYKPVGAVNGRR